MLAATALRAQGPSSSMFGNADSYERFMGRWSALVAPLLAQFARIPNEGRMLDVGCGSGSLAFSIARLRDRTRVQGIDPSAEFVAFASANNPFPGRVSFGTGDAQRLQFEDATFDACLSLLVFNFIPDPAKALGELLRVTKPCGPISAAVWDYGDGMRMLRVFWDAVVALDASAAKLDEARMPLCREGELSRLWKETGLEDVREEPLEIVMRFESFADFWEPFSFGQGPAGAYVRSLDERRRALLGDEVKQRLALAADDVAFTLPARVWAVRGVVAQR